MKHLSSRIILFFLLVAFYSSHIEAQVNVVTQHYDLGRTGWYNKETLLNKSNVHQGSFGKLFTRTVDDQLYAQPLIVQGVNITGIGTKNIVYLATVNNTVYAYDADSANASSPYWKVNLTPSGSRPIVQNDLSGACGGNFQSNIGIVGTPVIDTISNTIYLVARSINPNTVVFSEYLHALDIRTGAEKPNSPVLIQAHVNGTGDGSVNGVVSLDPERNNQRPGLLLLNGIVYIGFSSHCDWGPYHGWLLGYDATSLQQKFVYNDTPDGYNGGIWMSGTGIAADSAGNIYFATGNGSVGVGTDPTNLRNRSESVIRMNPTDAVQPVKDFFTPNNFPVLEANDLDLGTSAAMLIPNASRTVTGCKDGNIYLLDQANMGGYNSLTNQNLQTIDLGNNANMHAQFTYYRGTQNEFAYFWPENTALKAIPFNRSAGMFNIQNIITGGVQGPVGQTGAMMSSSSNGSVDSTAILWASYPGNCDGENYNCPGILIAFDALDVTKQLWSSGTLATDNPGNFAKFNSPVIANGKVYLGTFSNQLVVYGLQNPIADTCNGSNIALNKPAFASSTETTQLTASAAFDGNASTRWSSAYSDPQYIYVDLGKRYNVCSVHITWETALGKNFQIQISDDTTNWTTLANITNNVSYANIIPLQGTGRYLRMLGTARGTVYGYSIYEFEVYGKESEVQCATPVGLSVKNIYETSATFQWIANGADSFNVQYKTVNDVSWHNISTSKNQVTINGLICGTDYFFNVQGICSSNTASLISANTGFSTLSCGSNCGLLPSRWSSQDIGATAIAGSACYSNGTFTINASGNDIWDVADQFHFAYAVLNGNGNFTARVNTMDNSNPWNKCGIMFRESLDPGSRHAFIALTSGNGTAFQYRQNIDGTSTNTNTGTMVAPYWLRLIKNGSVYTAYASPDSIQWSLIGDSVDLGFGANTPVYCGLALTSHDNTILSTAAIDHLSSSGFTEFQLLTFNGELISPQLIKLSWTTALELNTDYFIVEKSTDNIHFSAIDSVPAADGGKFMENYSANDNSPDSGVNYYRLRMVDILGNYKYSQLVVIRFPNSSIPTMGPNPTNSTVTIFQGIDTIKFVNIYDFLGRRVMSINNSNTSPALTVSVYNLPKGVYVVEIRTTSNIFRKKLVKR